MRSARSVLTHGATGFKAGCRCQVCREDHKRESRQIRDRARERARSNPEIVPHGTSSGYTYWKCRCDECKRVKARPRKDT